MISKSLKEINARIKAAQPHPLPTGKPRGKYAEEFADREVDVLRMRSCGHTYEEIALRHGYGSVQSVHNVIKKHLNSKIREATDEVRDHEIARLDRQQARLEEKLRDLVNEDQRIKYETLYLKVLESRRKLFGLDAPVKTEAKIEGKFEIPELDPDQLAAAARAFLGADQSKCP